MPSAFATFIATPGNPPIWLPGADSLGSGHAAPRISIMPETPHIALAYVPVIDLTPDGQTVLAFLHCYSSVIGHTALLLHRCKDSQQPVYHCSGNTSDDRLVSLTKEQLEESKFGEPQWKEIYILMYPLN